MIVGKDVFEMIVGKNISEMNKAFLVFWQGDGGDSESYNVYHSTLVYAETKEKALEKYFARNEEIDPESYSYYSCFEMKPIE